MSPPPLPLPVDPVRSRSRARLLLAALLLALAVLAAFWPALENGFVDYDDNLYVTANPMVRGGLTLEAVKWAFVSTAASNWHPLTWISHQADVSWYGLDPRGHHLTSLLLHAINAILVLLLGRVLLGTLGASLLAAALFALHPLRVESVAWVAERKDVLAACWFFAGLLAYAWYVRKRGALRYALVVLLHVLGLLSKPMVVTFPVVLLLLDWWPLGRLGGARRPGGAGPGEKPARVLLEKLPLLLLSIAGSLATVVVQSSVSHEVGRRYLLGERLGNAVVSLFEYWGKTLAPVNLAYFYPHPGAGLSRLAIGAALVALLLATAAAWRARGRAPWLGFGWGWYLITISPVIGIVQVSAAALADRYTYLPFVGAAIGLGAGIGTLVRSYPRVRPPLAAGCCALFLLLGILSHRQVAVWRNGWSLATHAVAVTKGNWLALNDVGLALAQRGENEKGIEYLRESIRHQPAWHGSHYNLGLALRVAGKYAAAVEEFTAAARIAPEFWPAHQDKADTLNRWGISLADAGQGPEALLRFDQAIAVRPDYADFRFNRGLLLFSSGKTAEAVAELQRVLALAPDHAQAHQTLGEALARSGDAAGDAEHFRRAAR